MTILEPNPNGSEGNVDPHSFCNPLEIVKIGIGQKVLVTSNLFIDPTNNDQDGFSDSGSMERLIDTLNHWDGPGVLIFAGNLCDLLHSTITEKTDLSSIVLFSTLRELTRRTNVRVIILPGFRDSQFAYDQNLVSRLQMEFPFELALEIELHIEELSGIKKVTISSGREYDPMAKVSNPYSQVETPLAYHLIKDFWPNFESSSPNHWLHGVTRLETNASLTEFMSSKLLYKRLSKYYLLLLLPIIISFLIRIPVLFSLPLVSGLRDQAASFLPRALFIALSTLIEAFLLVAIVLIILRTSYAKFSQQNQTFRHHSETNLFPRLCASDKINEGYLGLISGHFLSPELSRIGNGFFACAGSVSTVYFENKSRFGLPAVFRPIQQVTWIEIEVGAETHVRLLQKSMPLASLSFLERIIRIRNTTFLVNHVQLATFPGGPEFRVENSDPKNKTAPRRIASAAIFLIGALNLASAITPPIRSRLRLVNEFVPLAVSQSADAVVAMASIGLIFLAGALRRGQKPAWALSIVLAFSAASLNLLKGGDFEEAITLLAITIYLIAKKSSFRAPMDRPSLARGMRSLVLGGISVILFSYIVIYGYISIFTHTLKLPYLKILAAVLQRMIGISRIPLPNKINTFATPALGLTGVGLVVIALFFTFRPVVDRTKGLAIRFGARPDREKARSIVAAHSKGTLDYFALRDDKRYFFARGCVVSYGNYGSVALVSPDPVGPSANIEQAWKDFRAFAYDKGWVIAVLGADSQWLDTYAKTGFRSIYVGDEAIVTLEGFSLDGKRHKGLRQAVNRIAKYGYRAEFVNPSNLDPNYAQGILDIMGESRQGEAERGFSMTLGRILDASDRDLLMTVCLDQNSQIVGFCQWVPAPGINGYSLDLMRRDLNNHPNGITDFMIVSTIQYLHDLGYQHLSLNFATMRAVLAGEMDSVAQRVEKWFLKRMSESMQIESLWRFNSKFDPVWHPRYVVYDNIEHAPAIALAIARAEAFWELPIIGRFLNNADSTTKNEATTI